LLGSRAVSLAFLWTINAAQADTFRAVVVQDFEGVAVEDRGDRMKLPVVANVDIRCRV
jgi:hypothetical protein